MSDNNIIMENVNCNLCGANDYSVKYNNVTAHVDPKDIFSATSGKRNVNRVVQCNQCGLIYVNPRVKSNIIIDSYVRVAEEKYMSQKEARENTFLKGLKFLENYSLKGNLLDVGCGAGFFLNVADKRGWHVYGVEPNRDMAHYACTQLKINVKQGTLKENKFPDNYFDVVTMWDALEHVCNPMQELEEVRRILKDDGILLINFPDIGSFPARISGRYWWFLLSSHIYYFTVKTLMTMLKKNKFVIINKSMHFQRLNLDYLLDMLRIYNINIPEKVRNIFRKFGSKSIVIPYYAGQTNMISKKVKR